MLDFCIAADSDTAILVMYLRLIIFLFGLYYIGVGKRNSTIMRLIIFLFGLDQGSDNIKVHFKTKMK